MEQQINTASTPAEQQLKLMKRMYWMSIVRTVACLLIFVVIAGSALYVLPGVKELVDRLTVVASSLEQIDITYMTESVTNLAVTGTESLEETMVEVTRDLQNLKQLGIASLNRSIADLGAIVEPLARLFGSR